MEPRGYIDEQGNRPFAVWFDRLDKAAAAEGAITLTQMENENFSNVKGVGQGVFESRKILGRDIASTLAKTAICW
jgi:putative component of toxin-antitoxin plasmid stabilization module